MTNSLNSMKSKLLETGIYKFSGSSNVENELKAYASELDRIFEKIDILERECFIDTAQTYGLSLRGNFLGYDRSDLTIEERRRMLNAAAQMQGYCTVDDFNLMLESYGIIEYKIVEHPSTNKLEVYVYDRLDDDKKGLIESRINEDFPIHLEVSAVFDTAA